jgi:hypothetical protein
MRRAMTNSQRVVAFVRQNRGKAFCDDCIQQTLGLTDRTGAHLTTKTLEHVPGFQRAVGLCHSCGSTHKLEDEGKLNEDSC